MYGSIETCFLNKGYSWPSDFRSDGRIHRFKRNSTDKQENAWYVCFVNNPGSQEYFAGAFGDWSEPGSKHTFCTLIDLDSEKRTKVFKKIEHQFELAQKEKQEECSRTSAEFIKLCGQSDGLNEYLTNKKIVGLHGALLSDSDLIVPIFDIEGRLWSYQRISPDGKKFFQSGTKKKGNFFPIGKIEDSVYLCEGFATGCTIRMATGKTVLVCFDAGNLVEVARVIRAKYKDVLLIICGDNDAFTEENPGKTKAQEAAKFGLGSFVIPTFSVLASHPTDFNDLYILEGLEKVRDQVLGVQAKISYVKCLGFKSKTYFYTSSNNLQISDLESHSEEALLKLMPKDFWAAQYPGKRAPIDWLQAKSTLTENCRQRGIFTKKDVRGHGVWVDAGKVVVHLGDRLFYDGEDHHVHSLMNQYVYEFDESLPSIHEKPLTDAELEPFLGLINALNYTHKQQAFFLGGWIALSGICGALKWRPHLWLTGEPGSGKSTIKELVDNYLANAFKRLSVIGATTEAGIRQAIKAASIPVIFDEFEPENKTSAERVQVCLELMRQASSENSSVILKGSADGDSISYYARFAALVCSVKPRLTAEADRSRFTYIHLERDQHSSDQWANIRKLLSIMTPEYCKRFFARMVKLIPVILKNQETLQKAFVDAGQSQRVGQQYGSLLAGFTALIRETEMGSSEANKMVSLIQLDEEDTIDGSRDQEEALEHLLNKRFQTGHDDMTVRDWILSRSQDLKILGMKDTGDGIFVRKNNPQISGLFMNSVWGMSWYMVLSRIKGIEKKRLRINGSKPNWGLWIPKRLIGQSESSLPLDHFDLRAQN